MDLIQKPSNVEPKRKKKKFSLEENLMECMDLLKDLTKEYNPKPETPATRLGRFIADELADLDEDLFFDAKWKIIDILKEANKEMARRRIKNAPILLNDSISSSEVSTTYKHSNKREFSETFESTSMQSYDSETDQYHNFSSFDDEDEIPLAPSPADSSNQSFSLTFDAN